MNRLCPAFFIKVDIAVMSMYNKGWRQLPMESILLLCGLAGVIFGVLESIRGDIER